jgi:hypothetical protein
MRLKWRSKPWRGLLAGAVGGVAASFLMGSVYALAQKACYADRGTQHGG